MFYFVTGVAGFIGYHTTLALLKRGDVVVGVDNLNSYYDPYLKMERIKNLSKIKGFHFKCLDICDQVAIDEEWWNNDYDKVIHLAAQAGVRYSITNPHAYIESNIKGFINILETCRHFQGVEHLTYASSSSVYGLNTQTPFDIQHNVDHPISLYAATKKSNELMAHAYSHLYKLPTTGLRFFTVYGPWGRPDMALFKFTQNIIEGKPIDVYNYGKMERDFTYIDDIVEGILLANDRIATSNVNWDSNKPDPSSSSAPYKLYNIGNNNPVNLLDFIAAIEKALNKKAIVNLMPIQPGDVPITSANVDPLMNDLGFKPNTHIEVGVKKFVDWYVDYYK